MAGWERGGFWRCRLPSPSLFPECIFRLFPSCCPSTTPGFTEIFKLHFQLLGLPEHHEAAATGAKLRNEVNQ